MDGFYAFLCSMIVVGVMSFVAGNTNGVKDMQKQSIERGHGLYCPNTGEFAWVGECSTDKPKQ